MADSARRSTAVEVIVPALLVALQLSLFGTHTIYTGNEAEFNAPFWTLERHLLLPASLILIALAGVGLCLSGAWRRTYVALLFSFGLLLWIQASFLVANYGPLDGTEIDWSAQGWRNRY